MALVDVLVLSSVLWASSFLFGLLPLWISPPRRTITLLSVLGMGILLGTSLGVIIPEGIETIYDEYLGKIRDASPDIAHAEPPVFRIAIALLSGFTMMLVVEQLSSRYSDRVKEYIPLAPKTGERNPSSRAGDVSTEDIDAEIALLEGTYNSSESTLSGRLDIPVSSSQPDPNLMTFGLIVHSLADGLAFGSTCVSGNGSITGITSPGPETSRRFSISMVVFIGIIIHKAPAALALSTTLSSLGISVRAVRNHIMAFSIAAPIGAILSYLILSGVSSLGQNDPTASNESWVGLILLFSGGSFLYVATILSPLFPRSSTHSDCHELSADEDADLKPITRLLIIVTGMFAPALIGGMLGHGH